MNVTITRPIASRITVTKADTTRVVASRTVVKVIQSGVGLQGAAGPAGGGVESTYDCPSTVAVADSVYLSGSNAVDRADSASAATCDAIGFVMSKPTTTTAVIRSAGQAGVFSGLVPNERYFVGSSGGITATPPSVGAVKRVGRAVTTTVMNIEMHPLVVL